LPFHHLSFQVLTAYQGNQQQDTTGFPWSPSTPPAKVDPDLQPFVLGCCWIQIFDQRDAGIGVYLLNIIIICLAKGGFGKGFAKD